MAVFEQVRQFVLLSGGKTTRLSREQKGRFVAICWIAQIYKYFSQPKASYVDDWEKLPDWQRETDAAIIEAVEQTVMAEVIAAREILHSVIEWRRKCNTTTLLFILSGMGSQKGA